MKQKIDIIQFTPYYPPHIGGVEKVVFDIHENWNHGNALVVTSDIGIKNREFSENIIVYPAFNIVNNFPFPKFWLPSFWKIMRNIHRHVLSDIKVITHTRFFFSSFIGGVFAQKNKLKWIHIEHGSAFVSSGNKIVDICSKIFDLTLGKWCIKKSDKVLAVSKAARTFLESTYNRTDIDVWYRGIDIPRNSTEKKGDICFVFIGRLTKLKNVSALLESYKKGNFTQRLYIIGDGEEQQSLKDQSKSKKIEFLGVMENKKIIEFLQKNKCIVINPSFQEGLPTTVIEGLITKNIVVASDVGGTGEISNNKDLILYEVGDNTALIEKMNYALQNFTELFGKSYDSLEKKFSQRKSIEMLYNLLK